MNEYVRSTERKTAAGNVAQIERLTKALVEAHAGDPDWFVDDEPFIDLAEQASGFLWLAAERAGVPHETLKEMARQ